MKLPQQFGGQPSGQAPIHQQIADPIKQWWRILQLGQPLLELFQVLDVLTAPQCINQRVLGWLT